MDRLANTFLPKFKLPYISLSYRDIRRASYWSNKSRHLEAYTYIFRESPSYVNMGSLHGEPFTGSSCSTPQGCPPGETVDLVQRPEPSWKHGETAPSAVSSLVGLCGSPRGSRPRLRRKQMTPRKEERGRPWHLRSKPGPDISGAGYVWQPRDPDI